MIRIKPVLFAILLTILAFGLVSQTASATLTGSEAAITFPMQGAIGVGVLGNTVGWGVSLDEGRILTHLGIYNYNGSGSADSDRQIGIWNSSGRLVAQATLPQGGGELADGFIWLELPRGVWLKAHEAYTIGAWYPDNSPGIAYNATVSTMSGVNYEKPSLSTGAPSFAQPTVDFTGVNPNGYFGPNMRFATDSGVRADREDILFERNLRRRNLLLNLAENYPPCGPGTREQRFVVSKDGTSVCDNKTGLWWQKTPGEPPDANCENNVLCTWQEAKDYCANLELTGNDHKKKQWRLAEVKELISLVDYSVPDQSANLNEPIGKFIDVQPTLYWSATEVAGLFNNAWVVRFRNSDVFSVNLGLHRGAWCVSGDKDAH